MFWHCPRVQSFIVDTKLKLFVDFRINLNIDIKIWFFPKGLSAMETCMITIAKRVIQESRLKESYPSFSHFKNKWKIEIEIECQSARQTSKYDQFAKKWELMRDVLETNSNVTYTWSSFLDVYQNLLCSQQRCLRNIHHTITKSLKHKDYIRKSNYACACARACCT